MMTRLLFLSLLFRTCVSAKPADTKCCLPSTYPPCMVNHVVYVAEQDKLIAFRWGRVIFADFRGPFLIPENPTGSHLSEQLRNYHGKRPIACKDVKLCMPAKVSSTFDAVLNKTMIHMRIGEDYVAAHYDGRNLVVIHTSHQCDPLVPETMRKQSKCPGTSMEDDGDGMMDGVYSYNTFTWGGKTHAMALTETGFFCVYEWKDESSDNPLSRIGPKMPECVPQSLFYDCFPSMCDSPIVDTIEYFEHGKVKMWELYRGSRDMIALPNPGNQSQLHPLISPQHTHFSSQRVTAGRTDRVSAIATDVLHDGRKKTLYFNPKEEFLIEDEPGRTRMLLSSYFDPDPSPVTAAWRDPDNRLLLFQGHVYTAYIMDQKERMWIQSGPSRQVSEDFIGVESIDSIFETPDELVIVVSRGRYAAANRSDWEGVKYDLYPIPYHPIHNPKGLLDTKVCNWTDEEAKEYFDRIDLMFTEQTRDRGKDSKEKRTGWMSKTMIWILIGLFLGIDVVIIAILVVMYMRIRINYPISTRNTDSIKSEMTLLGNSSDHHKSVSSK